MQVQLVMTVIGKDRTGLVESVARLVADHGGNWLESRMCRLGGEFAGILRVHVPTERRAALEAALSKLTGLAIVVRSDESANHGVAVREPRKAAVPTARSGGVPPVEGTRGETPRKLAGEDAHATPITPERPALPTDSAGEPQLASLEVVGHDRPGIVREITSALAAQRVNVEELATECVSAPMSGEPLFQARAKLLLPAGVTVGSLRQSLERAAAEIGVEFTITRV